MNARLAYLLATNIDVLVSTLLEGGQVQRLQIQLTEKEYELTKSLNEAKVEIRAFYRAFEIAKNEREEAHLEIGAFHRASEISKKERDDARAEASLKMRDFKIQQARAVTIESRLQEKEADLEKAVNDLDKFRDELAMSQEELRGLQADLPDCLETTKVKAKIEGLEESLELIDMVHPGLNLGFSRTFLRLPRVRCLMKRCFAQEKAEAIPDPVPFSVVPPVRGDPGPSSSIFVPPSPPKRTLGPST